MRNIKKRKKGSSFVIVLIITSIFFITGTSVLTMVGSDYKNRINESKRVQNLYEADSGLDIVYNLIMKNSEAAILSANSTVERMDNSQGNNYDTINNTFKDGFMSFLGNKSITAKNNNSDVLNVTETDAMLAQSINTFRYKEKDSQGNWVWVSINAPNATVELLSYDYNNTDKKITIGVRSTIVSTTGESKNQKTIMTTFTVQAPDYTDANIDIYPVYDKKIITADGDLSISQGNANITGDIWVKGTGETNDKSEESFNKYDKGIALNNTVMDLTGNIYTNRTLNLGDNVQSTITGDVYGVNAYLGPQQVNLPNNNNKLTITGDLITNNDLTLNSTNGTALMSNFYGINENTTTIITNPEIAARESSSIIINKESGNLLNITNKAYIMGVAYLDTGTKYQTGESIAVKGNYLAYGDVLPGYADRVELKYYSPLQLIEKIDGDSSLSKKAEYFQEYYKISGGKTIKAGGVSIGEVFATGAYVNKSNSSTGALTLLADPDVNAVMKVKREEFASNVLSMGDITGVINNTLANKLDIYTAGLVQKTVSNQINFGAIPNINIDNIASTSEKTINSDEDVEISGNTIKYLSKTGSKEETFTSDTKLLISAGRDVIISGNTNINAVIIAKGKMAISGKLNLAGAIISAGAVSLQCDTSDEKLRSDMKALIIAGGNIDISGKLNLTGNIITSGNIAVTGSDVKNLTYNADFTRGIISSNYKVCSNLFVGSPKNESVNMGTNMYNVKDYIKKGTWKIVK